VESSPAAPAAHPRAGALGWGCAPGQPEADASRACPLWRAAAPGVVPGGQFEEEGPTRACEALWKAALPGTGLEAKVKALSSAERRCMVAWMNETCASAFERMYDEAGEAGVVVLTYRKYRAATGQAAKDFTREACAEVPETPEQRRLLESLRSRLFKFLHE